MLSNITSINLDLQTQGSALVAKQINALVSPSRRIYVFGGASNVFPYFSTFANALTYANSLTPSTTNPVSVVLLSNTNGTPVEISGADDWYALCLDGIYVSSPYREIFSTTTLPTTLPKGMRVMYEDANGVESLWVGNADGVAWPAVGYKEYVASVTYTVGPISVSVKKSDIGTVVWTRSGVGDFRGTLNGAFVNNDAEQGYFLKLATFEDGEEQYIRMTLDNNTIVIANYIDEAPSDLLGIFVVKIRMFPS